MATKKELKEAAQLKAYIVQATKEQGYGLVDPSKVQALVDAGLVELNTAISSHDGKVAARATDKLNGEVANPETAVEAAPSAPVTFDIQSGIMPINGVRGGYKKELYPFGQLEVGQSFVVPATEKMPEPAKTFASTVSSATRRFAEKTAETKTNRKGETVQVLKPTKKFTLRPVTAGQKYDNGFTETVTGARVFRIA